MSQPPIKPIPVWTIEMFPPRGAQVVCTDNTFFSGIVKTSYEDFVVVQKPDGSQHVKNLRDLVPYYHATELQAKALYEAMKPRDGEVIAWDGQPHPKRVRYYLLALDGWTHIKSSAWTRPDVVQPPSAPMSVVADDGKGGWTCPH